MSFTLPLKFKTMRCNFGIHSRPNKQSQNKPKKKTKNHQNFEIAMDSKNWPIWIAGLVFIIFCERRECVFHVPEFRQDCRTCRATPIRYISKIHVSPSQNVRWMRLYFKLCTKSLHFFFQKSNMLPIASVALCFRTKLVHFIFGMFSIVVCWWCWCWYCHWISCKCIKIAKALCPTSSHSKCLAVSQTIDHSTFSLQFLFPIIPSIPSQSVFLSLFFTIKWHRCAVCTYFRLDVHFFLSFSIMKLQVQSFQKTGK